MNEAQNQQILLTGVNGFIGSHVAERLAKDGYQVRGLVRKTSDLKSIEDLDITLFYGDFADPDSLDAAVEGADIVIHIAGFVSGWGPYEDFYKANVTSAQNMAKSANRHNVRRFVHISSVAVHGLGSYRKVDETYPMDQSIHLYCETKKFAEQWLFDFANSANMEIVAIRPGIVYGPRDHYFIEFYLDLLQGGRLLYIDRGKHWTCPIYVENLVDGIVTACFEESAAGEAFILTDGLEINWKTFTEKFADELGVQRPRISVPFKVGYGLASSMEMVYKLLRISQPPLLTRYVIAILGNDGDFSIEKAKRMLKFEPSVDFNEAVRRTAEWYRQGIK